MVDTSISSVFQSLLDDAVAKGVGPGFQCVVFDNDSLLFNGVSGLASAPSKDAPDGKLYKPETLVWVASCTKLVVSLVVLHIVERGLVQSGFTMNDLDSHEALVRVLPEFRHGSGSLVTKIIEGFEDELGPDGRKVMKLRDVKGQVTLRMLLTHTAGMASGWMPPHMPELSRPSDGSVPNFIMPAINGDIRDFATPLVTEPNTVYHYSPSTDWLGQFAIRATNKNLRQLFKEIVFEPLGIPPSEADIWLSPSLEASRAAIHSRNPDGKGFSHIPFRPYQIEGEPPEGKAHYASACVYASLQGYSKILQAVLRRDSRILSENVWAMAIKDDLKDRGIKVPKPEWKSAFQDFTPDLDEYAKSTVEDGTGINLLQCHVARAPTVSGRPAGSFGWAGLANTYFFVDPLNGIGAIFGTQLFPFCDPQVIEMRDNIEALIYKTVVNV